MASKVLSEQQSRLHTSSCSTIVACGWQIVSASARGALHERSGAPNQDDLSWWSAEGDTPFAVLCVADGHGGSDHRRSHIGARLAVEQAQMLLVSEVLPRIMDGSALEDLARFEKQLRQQLPRVLVNRWLASVYEHATDFPVPRDETSRPERDAASLRAVAMQVAPVEQKYGTTLLSTLLTPKLNLFIQLGDGDILTVSPEGKVNRPPFEQDNHLIANFTTSLCSEEAWRFVRIHFQPIEEKPPALVLLATDGYANSFTDNTAFEQVAEDIRNVIKRDGIAAVARLLPGWLKETSGAGSGDDISVVVATIEGQLE